MGRQYSTLQGPGNRLASEHNCIPDRNHMSITQRRHQNCDVVNMILR
jgi:hypothetical protein